uniref:Uncharacterized protein n=1 Tax=Calcidiscus leptoporus TaxID=127549 RepID=A0A7S0J875_9EUKA|mmetsp:Transcript_43916/g.102667  ORF Transcript_43916/g.102667 Transcript_43916/m.102667 type:complete len:313 (+) Transcript_43916:53-991(+)
MAFACAAIVIATSAALNKHSEPQHGHALADKVPQVLKRHGPRLRHRPFRRDQNLTALARADQTYLVACLFEEALIKKPESWKARFYDPLASPFVRSDKCASHSYSYAYARYVVPLADRFAADPAAGAKVLEIGLGCGQHNVGAGVRMWDMLFANTGGHALTLHVLEYDKACAKAWTARWASRFKHVKLTMFTGSQSDPHTLRHVAREGGGQYDAIVDDGGHKISQQQASLSYLFQLLKPGAWYAVEDIQTSFMQGYIDQRPTMVETFGQIISWLSGDPDNSTAAQTYGHILPLVEHVDCYTEMCVLQRYPPR